jgi:hypothetical protein
MRRYANSIINKLSVSREPIAKDELKNAVPAEIRNGGKKP